MFSDVYAGAGSCWQWRWRSPLMVALLFMLFHDDRGLQLNEHRLCDPLQLDEYVLPDAVR